MDSQPRTPMAPTAPSPRQPERRTSGRGRRLRRYALVPAAALSVAVVLAGCDDTSTSSSPAGAGSTMPDSSTSQAPDSGAPDEPSPSGTTASEGSSAPSDAADPSEPATQAGPQRCAAKALTPALNRSDGGAGQIYYRLTLSNTSDAPCTLQGFPGVSLIKRDGGVIGEPAEREGAAGQKTVLKPGGHVEITLHTVNQGLTDAPCWDRPDYLKVYPPGSKEAVTLRTTDPLVCGDRFTTTAVGS
ncbi:MULTISPECIES: DUF4232 domain-containing protein [unclassified Streptomyces]|uniref:DUF4232 domain-containing protein n=1 Tax=unclassified Streptomyces TaxID=2593676 RepID=UPI0001C18F19|nr:MULTISPECIES: DUF4232 domain-containing protein [unclassified Streptomyces]AEN12983.1 serine/threonine protein kinase [Streptomyces sp. SirexAA-E]MYR69735.1 DUF4232 domain-containing protein [Streptomyces sp. SID4939]MYS00823.1 DUF4232 domain-containing protein [Streptomyces sp. SID4940]MYT65852.1 DUF4232 domain-containing protein [Streptomyces sp. SID8357]MYT84112.1 DUF4232 domain-containing protein [Streptomyces sp. SID8360]